MTLQFQMDADVCEEFFRRVQELPSYLDKEHNRIGIIKNMIREGYKITVFQTERTTDEIVEDASKHGNVLYYKLGDKPDEAE